MWRILLAGLVFSFSLSTLADEPQDLAKKPPYERLLKGEDAKRAEELAKQIAEREAADDYAAAIRRAEELIALREKLQGVAHYETVDEKHTAAALRKVADLDAPQRDEWRMATATEGEALQLHAAGKYAAAMPLFQKALDIRRRVLGEEHPRTATDYNNLALNLNSQGKIAEATPLFQKALDITLRVLGEEHPKMAASYNNLAFNLYARGKAVEAAPLLQKALDINRRVRGEEHPITAGAYNNLALNLVSQGRVAEASPLIQKALDTYRRVLGEEHRNTALMYFNFATNLGDQGKAAEAAPLFQKALDIRRRVLGEEHPDTADSYHGVAGNLNARGKAAEAATLYQKALDIRRRVLGEEHPDTATSYNGVAINLNTQGKFAEAAPLYQKALDIRRRVLGEEHPDTATSYKEVANNLDDQGKATEAAPLYQKVLDVRRRVLGEDHPETAEIYNSVAINLAAQGKAAEAAPLYQKALDIRRRVLGEEHPQTAVSYTSVAISLVTQDKAAEAEALLRRAIFSYEASRLSGAVGFERAALRFNPRVLLAAVQQAREPVLAWDELERTLARGFLDEQSSTKLPFTAEEEVAQDRDITRIVALQPQILALVTKALRTDHENARLVEILAERRAAEERLAALATTASTRSVAIGDVIRRTLSDESALLMWVDVTSTSGDVQEHFACVVRATGEPSWERLPGTGPEAKWTNDDSYLPRSFRTALRGAGSSKEVSSLAKQLHAQRIAPVLKHLSGVKSLYVVSANEMAGVPVEALTSEFTISYVPSGTFLARAKEKAPAAGREMLVVGDPVFSSSRLPGGNGQGSPSEKPAGGQTSNQSRPAGGTYLPSNGLLITQVAAGGAAAKGRLKAGDVIVKYGETEITSMKALDEAMEKAASAKEVTLLVWRESEKEPLTRSVAPGKLGVALSKEPAREAIANRRKTDAMLASLRGGGWKDLPGTRVELTQIGKLFGERTSTLVDSAASEESLEALRKKGDLTRFRYIHFATHGEGNQVKAFESALILSQDGLPPDPLPRPGEPFINGQLSAREVLDYWKLDAELVTLSACETAVGKQGGGDGLLGFAQAFLTAGARSVCLSLWKVDDTATALLMQRFYQNLLGKRPGLDTPMKKAAALDEAKRWLRELSSEEALKLSADMSGGVTRGTRGKGEDLKLVVPTTDPKDLAAKVAKPFADPRYWAAFILIGDPN